MIGASAAFLEMQRQIEHAAGWGQAPVLITGETGAGKELAALATHFWSDRRDHPFQPVFISGMSENLIADELFGHEEHSFTGAHEARLGKLATADGGTVQLDEIGELQPSVQVALLRFLDSGEICPLGADLPRHVDVRIVATTNRDLAGLIEQGRFRADLYYRLNVLEVRVPPLRERREDIPALAAHFLKEFCGEKGCALGKPSNDECRGRSKVDCLSVAFCERLMSCDWPGNVRELRAVVLRARACQLWGKLEDSHLQPLGRTAAAPMRRDTGSDGGDSSLESMMRRHIAETLLHAGNNVAEAAKQLRVPRSTLRDMIRRLHIFVR